MEASASSLRLEGRWLTLARAAWLAFFALATLTFLIAIPARWGLLTNPSPITQANLDALGWSVQVYAVYSLSTEILFTAYSLLIGLFIFTRRSDDGMALFIALMLVAFGVGNQSLTPTIGALGPVVFGIFGLVAWLTITQFPYIFPSGHFVPRWMRWFGLLWVLVVIPWNLMPGSALDPNTWPPYIFLPLLLILWGTLFYSQIHRYMRVSTPVQRQQTKWVFGALVLMISLDFLLYIPAIIADPELMSYFAFAEAPTPQAFAVVNILQGVDRLLWFLLPTAFLFSILRYRLWDIDILIRKTLTYALVAALLAAVYFGSVILLQQVFATVSGQRSEVVTVISTLLIAALFVPLRNRVQDAVDRRFYRSKYDAQAVLTEFSTTVRDETDLNRLTGKLAEVVQETMQPRKVSVWLKQGIKKS
jgi:hypothetical protein